MQQSRSDAFPRMCRGTLNTDYPDYALSNHASLSVSNRFSSHTGVLAEYRNATILTARLNGIA